MSTTPTQVDRAPSGLLEGKVAIVTGASRGIGAATARASANSGASVVLAARDEQALASVAKEIGAAGGRALAVATDVGDPASVERLVEQAVAAHGRLDIAFNNAGGAHRPRPLAEVPVEDFDQVVQVNLTGILLSLKYELPAMLASGGGAIVNMSSTAGLRGVEGIAGYVAAKHGIIGLTKAAALDYAGHNIRVNAVAPGPILTERLAQLDDETRAQIGSYIPLGRIGAVEEVAATVAWLCSEQASFISGATIPIDGAELARARSRDERTPRNQDMRPDHAQAGTMIRTLRVFLLVEAATFVAAALIHSGRLFEGYRHHEAQTAETVIAVVLLAGFGLSWSPAPWARRAAIGSQAFATLGVLVGLFTIAIRVGPRTALDIAYHTSILAVLTAGIAWTARSRKDGPMKLPLDASP